MGVRAGARGQGLLAGSRSNVTYVKFLGGLGSGTPKSWALELIELTRSPCGTTCAVAILPPGSSACTPEKGGGRAGLGAYRIRSL